MVRAVDKADAMLTISSTL